MPKNRLDLLLVERGLAESRAQAQALIMAGQVRAEGQVILKSSVRLDADVSLELKKMPRFVSRGGEKLEAALKEFPISVTDKICADVGVSTGGFSDCLLQHGAARVYAIDVGKGGLHWKLRNDPRVIVMEATNARYLASLPEEVSIIVVDVSFISLKVLLPVLVNWIGADGTILCLIKPQFEAGREEAARGAGVIRSAAIHRQVLSDVARAAANLGLSVHGLIRSPILGPKGNVEFLIWLNRLSSETSMDGLLADLDL